MRKFILRVLQGVIALAIVAGLSFLAMVYWFFYDNRMPAQASASPLDIAAIRQAAGTIPGPKATGIEVETLSHTLVPKIAMVAATSWDKVDMVRNSYRVVFPERALIIDTGQSREDALRYNAHEYDDAAWTRMLAAIAQADTVIVTHGHGDHAGGLEASADVPGIADAARLSAAQVATMQAGGLETQAFAPSLDYQGLFALAPGVVLIPAPGHTPGSQMVYVELADGREFLFLGDTASLLDNVRLGRIRSHYVTDRIGNDDRQAVFLQTAALQRMSEEAPDLILVPGHDAAVTADLVARGQLLAGFNGE
ncbi:MAG: MBL fold metallo-hydrolase [Hyphomonas sp.]|nr:MBL fold metallo-hydrolase [Hyphomonas sp.]